MVHHSSSSASSSSDVRGRPKNAFRNDGSFLQMFKKLQEGQTAESSKESADKETSSTSPPLATEEEKHVEETKPGPSRAMPLVGKRRGGRSLPTGKVKKVKVVEGPGTEETPKDAWSLYMQEVKRYRETTCEEEGKTRPLVK